MGSGGNVPIEMEIDSEGDGRWDGFRNGTKTPYVLYCI